MDNSSRPTGMPCPQCDFFIRMPIYDLLNARSFRCAGCGLELVVDRPRSQGSMSALQDLYVAMVDIEKVKRQSL